MGFQRFAEWFRGSSPYIRAHRGKRFVLLVPAAAFEQAPLPKIVRDIALLHVLDIKLVLVVETSNSEDVTTLKELFQRGLPSSPYRNQALPLYECPCPTALNSDELNAQLQDGRIPLIAIDADSTVDAITEEVAIAVKADKLIALHGAPTLQPNTDEVSSDLSTAAFRQLIESPIFDVATKSRMRALLNACEQGVNRAHIVSFKQDGALLAELFTADGSGTQISTDDYLTIRRATDDDIDDLLELMRTDIQEDRLVPRTKEILLSSDTTMYLAEHDNVPVGCVALYDLTDDMQELGTLVASPKHRDRNIGLRLLARAEGEARRRGAKRVYVFTKHAVEWFKNHDYAPAKLGALPPSRRLHYDLERKSSLLIKDLE